MSSLVSSAVRSVAGKITRSGLDTRSSRPPASTTVASDAMPGSSTARASPGHAHEPERLVAALDHPLGDLADTGCVDLPLRLGLDRAALERDERAAIGAGGHGDAAAAAEHARLVERLAAREVLLAGGVPPSRPARPGDPRAAVPHAAQPRVVRPHEAAVAALEGELAHVPDVALPVLGVVVEGALDHRAVL